MSKPTVVMWHRAVPPTETKEYSSGHCNDDCHWVRDAMINRDKVTNQPSSESKLWSHYLAHRLSPKETETATVVLAVTLAFGAGDTRLLLLALEATAAPGHAVLQPLDDLVDFIPLAGRQRL